ncbi:MAG: endonuclease/exonuclease/phosphatase family protein [Clostridia bacterium]|nr:endonuclease/exonuclease/phosphatase family protein [Clostridia bacterium]
MALRVCLIVLAALVVVVGAYVAYVFIAYHRIGDQTLTPDRPGTLPGAAAVQMHQPYTAVSYNVGFGAYEADYGFFMDGGTQSWAWSRERLDANLKNIAAVLAQQQAEIWLLQEVDIGSTRTYHVDERAYLQPAGKACVFAQNYDSPFLFYPLLQPHGRSRSGIMTLADFPITAAQRIELPIESGLTKLLDLDRCYSKCRLPVEAGGELVLYNFHLSAYTSDGTIATEQLILLLDDMERECAAGRYCIAGGDFNKDLLGDSSEYFGRSDQTYTWAQPIPPGTFDGRRVRLIAPLDTEHPVPSCRNADGPYHPGQFVVTPDGFLVSDTVQVLACTVVDTGFAYSDHNPVTLQFQLN